MGQNVTRTNRTNINNTNNGGGNGGKSPLILDPVPAFRPGQEINAITIQFSFAVLLLVGAITINIMMAVLLQKKFKTIPYMMLLNVVVVDIVTPLLNGPMFVLGIILDHLGIILPNFCNVQGFFHAAFGTVFLNTVTLVAVSRCLAVLRPDLYHKIFVNKIVMRLLSLCLWSSSALLCVPPLNRKGWGAYKRFESTCWLAWIPDNPDYMAYNSLITIISLGTAVASCILGLFVLYSVRKVGAVAPSSQALPPPPYPGTVDMNNGPIPEKTTPLKIRVNTEVFAIVGIQLIAYIVLWVPLTVMNSIYVKDWRNIEFRVIISFLFLYFARSLFNPIACFAISSDMRRELYDLIFRCRCLGKQNEPDEIEL